MSKAIQANAQIGLIAEVTENTTPATPAFQLLRVTGENLQVQRKDVYSSELGGFRGQSSFAIASAWGEGTIDGELTYGTLDTIMEALLRTTYATNVLTDGNTPKTFTIETKFEAGATDVYKRLTGAQFNTGTFNFKAADKTTFSLGLMSLGADFANAIVAGATYVAGNTEVLQVGPNFGAATLSGLTFDQIASLSLTINNNLRKQDALGSLSPVGIAAGELEVTGSISFYLDSTAYTVLRAGADGTPTGLTFETGTVAGKKTRFELPNIILESPDASAPSKQGDVMATFNFRALQASTLSRSVIRVTRNI